MSDEPGSERLSGTVAHERLDPETWVDDHGGALFRYAQRRVNDSEIAGDLVQETFLAALRAVDRFEGRAAGRSWLIAILKRKIGDHFRARRRPAAQAVPLSSVPEEVFDRAGKWIHPPKPWHDPEHRLRSEEFRDVLDGCLEGLPAHLADPFILREREEHEPSTIRSMLRLTEANLRVRLHRARLLLRACLESRAFHG